MKNLFTLLLLGISCTLSAQIDFNNFVTLQSQGAIPDDFSKLTKIKVTEDHEKDKKGETNLDFKQNIHYSIERMLHSGTCIYGDPISKYVEQVAQRLLSDDLATLQGLRFYTIKSNIPNAFSTHQGIIVFTTGLISQFANETQLAFVLAHEIGHYQEKHVVQQFEWKQQNKNGRNDISQFSKYSKEKEFEADARAVELCLKAGYNANELYNSFDVLMYCHLPFDEIPFDLDYFNNEKFYVPVKQFTTQNFPIKADEYYNDEGHTHPNIGKRKMTIHNDLVQHFGTGSSYFLPENHFEEVRNLARFETIRINIIEQNIAPALYSIFLLEKNGFKNNYTLTRWKVHAWNVLLQGKIHGNWSEVNVPKTKYEGESAVLYKYIRDLDKSAVIAHTLRQMQDAINQYPESEELKKLKRIILINIGSDEEFSFGKFKSETFEQATKRTLEVTTTESNTEEVAATPTKTSKYDRIKSNHSSGGTSNGKNVTVDSSKYFLYGISDLINDRNFIKEFEDLREVQRLVEKARFVHKRSEGFIHPQSKLGNRLILVEPATSYSQEQSENYVKADEKRETLTDAILNIAADCDVKIIQFTTEQLAEQETTLFNNRSVMMNYFNQNISGMDADNFIPIDYELVQSIQQIYGTNQVLYAWSSYQVSNKGTAGTFIKSVLFPPLAPLFIMLDLRKKTKVNLIVSIINIEEGRIELLSAQDLDAFGSRLVIENEIYNIFQTIK